MNLKIDLVQYIAGRTPAAFFPRAVELLEAAYFAAFQHSETFDEPERRHSLGYLRHHRCNEALRNAGSECGLVAVAPHTTPKGARFSLVAAEDIRFGRISVPLDNKQPRPSKHRKTIAALNSRLEPLNADLFSEDSEAAPSDGLGCLLLTVNPHKRDSQSVPASVLVGVPYTNLRGWHLLEPVSQIMAAYHPTENIEVPDQAFAKLKKQLGDSEK